MVPLPARTCVNRLASPAIEDLLSIDLEWSHEQIREYLRREFAKWNARLNTMAEGPDRDHAQYMLDKIGEARIKYGGRSNR